LEEAMQKLLRNCKLLWAKPMREIICLSPLYSPCPECGTEQIDLYGCPNINCPGKKK